MNALIFGANGQDGFYLSALLNQQGVNVIGIREMVIFCEQILPVTKK